MSDKEDLLESMDEIRSVSTDTMNRCPMPLGIYLAEAEALYVRASQDLQRLQAVGMQPELLPRLLKLTGAVRMALANWEELTTVKKEATQTWKKEAPAMYELRDELIDHLEFAYRKDEHLLDQLVAIKEGSSHADAIQDLANLAVLGKDNPAPIEAINYDLAKLDEAAQMADRMAGLLGAVNGQMYTDDETKIIRDKGYTLLKQVVNEIRDYGKFVFRKDADYVKGYSSKYERDRAAEYRRSAQS